MEDVQAEFFLPGSVSGASTRRPDETSDVVRVVQKEFAKLREWLDQRLDQRIDVSSIEPPEAPVLPLKPGNLASCEDLLVVDLSTKDECPADDSSVARVSTVWESSCEKESTNGNKALIARQSSRLNKQQWHTQLMDLFNMLDTDGSGTIDLDELKSAFEDAAVPVDPVMDIFAKADASGNNSIDRIEWLHLVEHMSKKDGHLGALVHVSKTLVEIQRRPSFINKRNQRNYSACIIPHDSSVRMCWDMFMVMLLVYVSLTLPFNLGFGQIEELAIVDLVFDFLFMFDIVLNFRTSYIDNDEITVKNGWKIGCHYLRTWFLLDLVSSVPWDYVTAGFLPNLQSARLLKVGKIAKVFKILRISKTLKTLAGSELTDKFEDLVPMKAHQTTSRISYLVGVTMVICHWLACFLAFCDGPSIDMYLGSGENSLRRYIAALYWAMTTLTTVGYGDLVPKSDSERIYAMLAMIVGGSFYGYIIGSITSVVTDMDIDARTFSERMDVVEAWLDHHGQLPSVLRRRIRRHFREQLSAKTSVDDRQIVGDLSPELRADAAYFIIHGSVRKNPVFADLPNSAMATFVDVLKSTASEAHDTIVSCNDPGTAMYIITEGCAGVTEGFLWIPPPPADAGAQQDGLAAPRMPHAEKLLGGDSFGEEIIFGLVQTYRYTIVAATPVSMYELAEDAFIDRFKNLPDLRSHMLFNYIEARRWKLEEVSTLLRGASKLRIAATG
eukprot:TRINITY_DN9397_c0_g4_i1.p1 TRINITY_DN9397_c0_g4~~TRINITY_DN9397_c0_g4_i1.p1  ORF type:complete len:745 (+),score=88.97 TRINITY_DN9397_c0_g4_i1:61-2235(+)